jgi:hypothetical protein
MIVVGVQPFVIFFLVALLALQAARKRGLLRFPLSVQGGNGLLDLEGVDRDR